MHTCKVKKLSWAVVEHQPIKVHLMDAGQVLSFPGLPLKVTYAHVFSVPFNSWALAESDSGKDQGKAQIKD